MNKTTLCTAVILAISSAQAYSQDIMLEEVLVVAQKRTESLQDVPVSVTAFSQEMMDKAGIVGIDNIAQFTPGFSMTSYNKATPQPYIRGIGTNVSGAGDDPSVAMFVDEVYISRPGAFDANLFDLQRIEVLRGPQGTLFGKNVVGGAIIVSTSMPNTEELEVKAQVDVGNYDQLGLQAYVSGPLTDNIAGKLALAHHERDGYIKNTVTGNKLNDDDSQDARLGLLWDASDAVTVNWSADISKIRNAGVGRVLEGEPLNAFLFPGAKSPSLNTPDKTESVLDGYTDRDTWGTTLRINWEQPYGTWTSVTGYRENDYKFLDDFIPAEDQLSYLVNFVDEQQSQFSQEIRLASPDSAGDWEWLVGLYYFNDDINRLESWDSTGLSAPLMLVFGVPGGLAQWNANNETESTAAFGQLSYNLENWRFTLGGRYTSETKDFALQTSGFEPLFGMFSPFSINEKEDWDNFSGKFSVDYMGVEDVLIYLSVSEGFKSGSFNSVAPNADLAAQSLDPELATQIELGLKSQWLDNRLRLNAAAFDIDYTDLQVFTSDGLEQIVDNAGEATSRGIELEVIALPIADLELSATYAYLDATYDKFVTGGLDFSGNNLTRSPKNSYTLSADYGFSLGDSADVSLRMDYLYQDKFFRESSNVDLTTIDSYGLLNARMSVATMNGNWELSLWGKNLTDEEYDVFRSNLSDFASPTASAVKGAPRTYGVTFTYGM